ncbi:hypothetical protein LMG28614_04271 [Paraburkholderia ultramafica]|uniref:Uncharacterized protein n=2 Tax=Paraburkholderia ultramafica TaxID=1544867 RepID=A0A6S7BQC7_9BURK|nr:hypothetical protein LMG28614_04271 [Paraburkholderia ultramafica]
MMKSKIHTAIERRSCGAYIIDQLRHTAKFVKRTKQWVTFLGEPLTLTGYVIIAVNVAAVLLVAMLSTCWARDGIDCVFRVGSWFS